MIQVEKEVPIFSNIKHGLLETMCDCGPSMVNCKESSKEQSLGKDAYDTDIWKHQNLMPFASWGALTNRTF